MFLPRGSYELVHAPSPVKESTPEKDEIKRKLYSILSEHTGMQLPWGILTGVKPVKLFGAIARDSSIEAAVDTLKSSYFASEQKAQLCRRVYEQELLLPEPENGSVSLYIGIPYCPSRCHYCSFTTEIATPAKVEAYTQALLAEVRGMGEVMKDIGLKAECIYIGGGTPTTLGSKRMEALLAQTQRSVPKLREDIELTVEAGRPETIDDEICAVMKGLGVNRVSVNAQTMNDRVLESIGRSHSAAQTREAFLTARNAADWVINTDLIAALPGEREDSFADSLAEIIGLGAENITVHCLALKRGSRFTEEHPELSYESGGRAIRMVEASDRLLSENGYSPYYTYRQKLTVDNLENTGYSKSGSSCMYNIRIVQEKQSVLALGAGGISKVYFAESDRLERVANAKDPGLYVSSVDELVKHKARQFERKE
jgi:oxygen-independent coproporphyrinogen-3 oxidase